MTDMYGIKPPTYSREMVNLNLDTFWAGYRLNNFSSVIFRNIQNMRLSTFPRHANLYVRECTLYYFCIFFAQVLMTHYARMHPVISIHPQSSTTYTAKYGKALKYWTE